MQNSHQKTPDRCRRHHHHSRRGLDAFGRYSIIPSPKLKIRECSFDPPCTCHAGPYPLHCRYILSVRPFSPSGMYVYTKGVRGSTGTPDFNTATFCRVAEHVLLRRGGGRKFASDFPGNRVPRVRGYRRVRVEYSFPVSNDTQREKTNAIIR